MRNNNSERFVAHGNSIEATNAEVEKEVQGYQDTLAVSLNAAIQPVKDLAESINVLHAEGRQEDVPKLTGLVKMLARDADVLIAEKKVVDEELAKLQANPPTKKRHLSNHHAGLMAAGAKYLGLSQRATNTVGNILGDYMDLIDPLKSKPETAEQSEAVS